MAYEPHDDWYEVLQISPNADPELIHRVFRLLAQRYHPDNHETGDPNHFRRVHQAYQVLSDPEKRAQFDATHEAVRRERWRFAATTPPAENDFDREQHMRCVALEILYTRRRVAPDQPSLSPMELVHLTGQPREHLEFTLWYLLQKKLVARDDHSNMSITAEGVDYIETSSPAGMRRRLTAVRDVRPA